MLLPAVLLLLLTGMTYLHERNIVHGGERVAPEPDACPFREDPHPCAFGGLDPYPYPCALDGEIHIQNLGSVPKSGSIPGSIRVHPVLPTLSQPAGTIC